MALFNNLTDKAPTNSNNNGTKKESTPLSSCSSSPFPSVSSLLHGSPATGSQQPNLIGNYNPKPSTTPNSLELPPPAGCIPMNLDSSGNKRGMPWQEQERDNKHPRRSADTITNGQYSTWVGVGKGRKGLGDDFGCIVHYACIISVCRLSSGFIY
jgi:hypothetical protein